MAIKKIELTNDLKEDPKKNLKIGNLVRVKILDNSDKNNLLVELNGKRYVARLKGNILCDLFIAKVVKVFPEIELKYLKRIDNGKGVYDYKLLEKLIISKKSFIQNLINSDNFLVNFKEFLINNKRNIKDNLKQNVLNQNILNLMSSKKVNSNDVFKYYILQNLYNFINYDSLDLLFPIRISEKNYFCNLKINRSKDSIDNSIFLTIFLKNKRKIGFLVFIDYEVINCTILTNDLELEKKLRSNISILIKEFKSLNYNRKVKLDFEPYSENIFNKFNSIKKIDLRM